MAASAALASMAVFVACGTSVVAFVNRTVAMAAVPSVETSRTFVESASSRVPSASLVSFVASLVRFESIVF